MRVCTHGGRFVTFVSEKITISGSVRGNLDVSLPRACLLSAAAIQGGPILYIQLFYVMLVVNFPTR